MSVIFTYDKCDSYNGQAERKGTCQRICIESSQTRFCYLFFFRFLTQVVRSKFSVIKSRWLQQQAEFQQRAYQLEREEGHQRASRENVGRMPAQAVPIESVPTAPLSAKVSAAMSTPSVPASSLPSTPVLPSASVPATALPTASLPHAIQVQRERQTDLQSWAKQHLS